MFTSYLNEHLTYFERYTRFLYIGNYFYFFKVGTLIVPQGSTHSEERMLNDLESHKEKREKIMRV